MWVQSIPQMKGTIRVTVRGFIFIDERGSVRLCEELLESYPPQCGGASLVVENFHHQSVPSLQESQGIFWSERPVDLSGTLTNGVLALP